MPLAPSSQLYAPGSRIVVRDAEWLVRRVDRTSTGGQALLVSGLSELVRDREAIFLTEIEPDIQILRPEDTRFVQDTSPRYLKSLLYLESALRQLPPTIDANRVRLHVGHRAAMDVLPYQLVPALQALAQPRQRILIADTVGLGKTLEAGILLSELIERGRGKRILVLTVKSMLTQFQKEMWNRFSIPLVRLDSVGLQRVRAHIPTNHNPFFYYDKAIISIDTLKQDREYRYYLENAYWDIIVIDEAHHVAERGNNAQRSQRARLAQLLSSRSDTLIMLSATPHDGKARTFASLMNMLNPTAIANPEEYGPEDIQGLFIRRFKKDVQDQIQAAFLPRTMAVSHAQATQAEERAFEILSNLKLTGTRRVSGTMLFKTTLEKALFSSPAACLETINKRLTKQNDSPEPTVELESLAEALRQVTPDSFGKFQKLLSLITKTLSWNPQDPQDRLVIFTERIETLRFLSEHLSRALGLKEQQVTTLHGGMPDTDQQAVVEAFGQADSPLRLLIASDVASEGINLHFQCHRLIHFDIPWSLMVFQQRNGRIDRYGQEQPPEIYYLMTDSENTKIRGDNRILELLIEKDHQAGKNIGDPSALMKVYDVELEELKTASALEDGLSPEAFEADFGGIDPLEELLRDVEPAQEHPQEENVRPTLSLFSGDYEYVKQALQLIQENEHLPVESDDAYQTISFSLPEDLRERYQQCPREVNPSPAPIRLTADSLAMKEAIKESRSDESAWPSYQYLWPLHPVVGWINDKVTGSFGRHEAPVLALPQGLQSGEVVFLMVGVIPNRKSHPLIQSWFGVSFQPGMEPQVEELPELLARTGLGKGQIPNPGLPLPVDALSKHLLPAIEEAKRKLSELRSAFNQENAPKLQSQLEALAGLRRRKLAQLSLDFSQQNLKAETLAERKAQQERSVHALFDEYQDWIRDTMTTEDHPHVQIMAVLLAPPSQR